ncbi:MAG TPA: hypothetical protein VEC35_02465 [Noviherbaspirillum sp.]|nr:hypothetical protein [Noviherbaspirillum sp.]
MKVVKALERRTEPTLPENETLPENAPPPGTINLATTDPKLDPNLVLDDALLLNTNPATSPITLTETNPLALTTVAPQALVTAPAIDPLSLQTAPGTNLFTLAQTDPNALLTGPDIDPALLRQVPPGWTPLTLPPLSPLAGLPPPTPPGQEPKPVNSDVQAFLDFINQVDPNTKKSVVESSWENVLKRAKEHLDQQLANGETPDLISQWFQNMLAKSFAEGGMDLGHLGTIPTNPIGGMPGTSQIFPKGEIDAKLQKLLTDQGLKDWLQNEFSYELNQAIGKNEYWNKKLTPLLNKDALPDTLDDSFIGVLKKLQMDRLNDPKVVQYLASATPEERQKYLADLFGTLGELGTSQTQINPSLNQLITNLNQANPFLKLPTPALGPDGRQLTTSTGDKLITPAGNLNTYVAVGPDGTVRVDENGRPYVYDQNGNQVVDANGNHVLFDPMSGATVLKDANGKIVTDSNGNTIVVDKTTGKPLTSNVNGKTVNIVVDQDTKSVIAVDENGDIVTDDKHGYPIAIDKNTGQPLKDPNGNQVLILDDPSLNGAPVGVIIDDKGNWIVTDLNTGQPMVDPSTRSALLIDPETMQPEVRPIGPDGQPLVSPTNGNKIILDENGNKVELDPDSPVTHLVDDTGNRVKTDKGHELIVDPETGRFAAWDPKTGKPVDDGKGNVFLYDKTGKPIVDPKTNHRVAEDQNGNLIELVTNGDGSTYVYTLPDGTTPVFDPKTGTVMTIKNGPTEMPVGLAPGSNHLVATDPTSGQSYLVNPDTREVFKTKDGQLVVMDPTTKQPTFKDPTGKTLVFDPATGESVVDPATGSPIQVINGKTYSVDPNTGQIIGEVDMKTRGVQLVDANGNPLVDANGNRIQRSLDTGYTTAVGADGKPVKDDNGNTVLYDATGKPMVNPATGNTVVLLGDTPVPVEIGPDGKPVVDPKSGGIIVIDPKTGKPVVDPATGNRIVVDPNTGASVGIDADGNIIKDANGYAIVHNSETGQVVLAPDGKTPLVVAPGTGMPVWTDPTTNIVWVMDPKTGQHVKDPKSGAAMIIDPATGVPIFVKEDAPGTWTLIDPNTGKQRVTAEGNKVFVDPKTGALVYKKADGSLANLYTNQAPELIKPGDMFANIDKLFSSTSTDKKIVSAVRNAAQSIYYGKVVFDPVFAKGWLNTSKYFNHFMSLAGIVATAVFYSTDDYRKRLNSGDPNAIAEFFMNVGNASKYANAWAGSVTFTHMNILKSQWTKVLKDFPELAAKGPEFFATQFKPGWHAVAAHWGKWVGGIGGGVAGFMQMYFAIKNIADFEGNDPGKVAANFISNMFSFAGGVAFVGMGGATIMGASALTAAFGAAGFGLTFIALMIDLIKGNSPGEEFTAEMNKLFQGQSWATPERIEQLKKWFERMVASGNVTHRHTGPRPR